MVAVQKDSHLVNTVVISSDELASVSHSYCNSHTKKPYHNSYVLLPLRILPYLAMSSEMTVSRKLITFRPPNPSCFLKLRMCMPVILNVIIRYWVQKYAIESPCQTRGRQNLHYICSFVLESSSACMTVGG